MGLGSKIKSCVKKVASPVTKALGGSSGSSLLGGSSALMSLFGSNLGTAKASGSLFTCGNAGNVKKITQAEFDKKLSGCNVSFNDNFVKNYQGIKNSLMPNNAKRNISLFG